jgi:glycosyltransferase involved in cell wall biosynthesis
VSPDHGLALTIVGDGPLSNSLADRYPSFDWAGRLSSGEVRRLMMESRALVFPSRWYEGQPMVLLEAFSAGLPTLVVGRGGHIETARPLGDDWLVEHRADLADALHILADDAAVDRAGSVARSCFEASYSPDAALDALESAYRLASSYHGTRSGD